MAHSRLDWHLKLINCSWVQQKYGTRAVLCGDRGATNQHTFVFNHSVYFHAQNRLLRNLPGIGPNYCPATLALELKHHPVSRSFQGGKLQPRICYKYEFWRGRRRDIDYPLILDFGHSMLLDSDAIVRHDAFFFTTKIHSLPTTEVLPSFPQRRWQNLQKSS